MGQVPALVKLASAGTTVGDRLTASAAELSRQRTALAADRAGLESARELLARLAEVEAERNQLRGEILRAQQASAIERELPALRQTLTELTAVVSATGSGSGDANAVIHGLIAAGRRLAELTEEQRSILDAGNDRLAARVADATSAAEQVLARRDELVAELETRNLEAAELRAAEETALPGLRARRQADAELVTGLLAVGPGGDQAAVSFSALEHVRAELAELGRRVENAESRLKPLLRQHQQAYDAASKVR
jgi:DNA repair exonuclease SbcCD ATPase subunit